MSVTAYVTGGLALAVAVMWGLWTYQVRQKNAQIEAAVAMVDIANAQVQVAKVANDANAETLAAIKADLERQREAAAKFEALARTRSQALNQALKRINNAPASDDGPLAPILSRELDGLRLVQPPSNPPADRPDENPGRIAPDLIEPVMPATPDPAGP